MKRRPPAELPEIVRTLVDAAIDAATVVNRDQEILYYNAQFLRLTGLRKRELDASSLRGWCHNHFGLEPCADRCISLRALELGRPVRLDEVASTRLPLRLILTAVPLVDDDGAVYAVLEQYRDVTAESRLQENYRALLEKERAQKDLLTKEVARQTAELEHVNESLLAALNEVSRVAHTDALTGLANRRSFDDQLRAQIARSQRREAPMALLLFDLDNFKSVNDEYGHPVGDQLLKDFAHALSGAVREAHLVSRIGGEEFAVILPSTAAGVAERVAERVQERSRAARLLTTTSVGIAAYPEDGTSATELLRSADAALYTAKDAGRNCIICASSAQAKKYTARRRAAVPRLVAITGERGKDAV